MLKDMAGAVAFALMLLSAIAQAEPAPERDSAFAVDHHDNQRRAALLREYLKVPAARAPVERYFGAVAGSAFAGIGLAAAFADFDDPSGRQKPVTVAAAGGLALVSFSSYLVPERYRRPVLDSLPGLMLISLGSSLYVNDYGTNTTHFVFGSMIATGLAWEGLVVLDTALLQHLPAHWSWNATSSACVV